LGRDWGQSKGELQIMNFVGIDIHKRYSLCVAQDEQGRKLGVARIEGNAASGFAQFFKGLGGPSKVVIEACWNWGKIHDLLETLPGVAEVQLANPLKTRLIGCAQIKTDKIDANALASLLRGRLIARAHVPAKAVRQRKDTLRQRLYWARLRTRIRNRIHALLDRQPHLELPLCTDLFGVRGMSHLRKLELPGADGILLRENLALMDLLNHQIKEQEKRITADNDQDEATRLIQSIPGLGPILASVIAAEIDGIDRFPDSAHLCACAGLVPTTHASGGQVYHGGLLWACNKWLRWAFIEGAWLAVAYAPYFGSFYRQHRARGKKANTAITIVARRMCQIVYCLLREHRPYHEQPKPFSPVAPIQA
jgi:transposase